MHQRDRVTGKFIATAEKNSERIWLRVPGSAYLDLIDFSGGDISTYARQAILEKLERDKQSQILEGANN